MAFQSTVNIQMGAGVIGELANDSPVRAQSFTINSPDATNNVFGRAFTKASEGVAQAGSAGARGFAGVLINPKGSALYGTAAGGTLAPSLTLANNAQGEILSMGSIWVTLPATANIGDNVIYNNTTGVLSTIAQGVSVPAGSSFAFALVDYLSVTSPGLAIITLTPTLAIPTQA